jgi:DNA-binding MarR family transcriptional regulator
VEFGHKRSTLTSILNRLEARELITCRVNSADRRSLLIGLTATGQKIAASILEKLQEFENEILGAFSPRDQKNAAWVLAAVTTVAARNAEAT